MIKALVAIVVVLLVAVAGVLAYAATRPGTFRIERAISINAPPDKIFPLINDFRNWASWSPYERKDPTMRRTYGGPPRGKGAVYGWEGNSDVGSGRIEILDTSPPIKVRISLDMIKPFAAHNEVVFALEPRGDTTTVTWAMNGDVPFLAKVVHMFLDVDKMVGRDFEQGLAGMKAEAEK